jgi:sugar phosphate isomerase/epimerase
MNRRNFLSLTAVAGTAALLGGTPARAAAPARTAKLNLCHQWNNIPGGEMNAKLDYLEQNGYAAFELPGGPKNRWLFNNKDALLKAMNGRKLFIATACGPSDFSSADPKRNEAEVQAFLPQLEMLGELKAVGLILCPARRTVAMGHEALWKNFTEDTGRRLAEHAAKHGTSIVLEPLNKGETPFLNTVGDGVKMAKAMNSKGAKVMGDFWHMSKEEKDLREAFASAGDLMVQVHIASLGNRGIPGSEPRRDHDKFVAGFGGLKAIGYQGAVSFEGKTPKGDRAKIYADMCKYIRDCWDEAKA